MCGGDYQSPIDLKTDFKKIKHADESFFKHYEDLESDSTYEFMNKWIADSYTTKLSFSKPGAPATISTWKPNYFYSELFN